jgi:hypothetical protein
MVRDNFELPLRHLEKRIREDRVAGVVRHGDPLTRAPRRSRRKSAP